ncbi:MAG: DUF1206 domain-containing protein [Solirubrobacterales bacterium]
MPGAPADEATRAADRAARSETLGRLARAGMVARGLVYLIIAVLAVKLAIGEKGTDTDQQEALRTIAEQSLGDVLLVLVAAGVAGYALWMLARAAIGHGVAERDSGFDRISALASAVAYGVICATAIGILVGSGSQSGSPKETTGGVLGWPGGTVLVAIAGAVVIGVGIYQAYKGFARKFLEEANTRKMSPEVRKGYTTLGVFGYVARSVVFVLVGYGLIKAAVDYDPKKAVGLDGALHELANSSYGPPVLWVVAVGLAGFGLYSVADARYHRV